MLRSFILAAAALVLVANVASAQDKVARGAAVYAEAIVDELRGEIENCLNHVDALIEEFQKA